MNIKEAIKIIKDEKLQGYNMNEERYNRENEEMCIRDRKRGGIKAIHAGEMEQKGVRFYCLYRFAYFSYWDDSYNTDSSSYGDVSGFIRWNNRGYLFSLRRIYGSGKSKKMFTDK